MMKLTKLTRMEGNRVSLVNLVSFVTAWMDDKNGRLLPSNSSRRARRLVGSREKSRSWSASCERDNDLVASDEPSPFFIWVAEHKDELVALAEKDLETAAFLATLGLVPVPKIPRPKFSRAQRAQRAAIARTARYVAGLQSMWAESEWRP
jgi:hypothetical protein